MNKLKALTAALTAFSMCLAYLPVTEQSFPETVSLSARALTRVGTYGDVMWQLDDDGTMTISGSGDMGYQSLWEGNEEIKKLIIEDGVTNIGLNAFKDCKNLTSVQIPSSVTKIMGYAFSGCSSLTDVQISYGVTNIGKYAFEKTGLVSVEIPASVKRIEEEAFHWCPNLKTVDLYEGLETIAYGVFEECSSLTSITIPASVEGFGGIAFYHCFALESITIKNPDCGIYGEEYAMPADTVIYGYPNSTAQAYAEEYNRKFIPLEAEPAETTTTTPETTTTTKATTTTTKATTTTTKATTTTTKATTTTTKATTTTTKATTTTTKATTTTTKATTTTTTTTTAPATTTTTEPTRPTTFTEGADNWSFSNVRSNFGNTYYMKDSYWNALLDGLTNVEKDRITGKLQKPFGGSCYGMASTSILASYGILHPADYQKDAVFLHDISRPLTDDVKSLINYYYALQFTDAAQQKVSNALYNDNEKEKLQILLDCLEDDSPTLLCFYGYWYGESWSGHAVVAYDVEYGTYRLDGKVYNGKIVIYDNNNVNYSDDYCLYFNSSDGSWCHPYYELDSRKGSMLGVITDDLDYINYHGYLNGSSYSSSEDYIAVLHSSALDNYKLVKTNYNDGDWTANSTSNDDIKVFASLADDNAVNTDLMFSMKDAESGYLMKTSAPEKLDLSLSYENSLLNISASSGSSAKFSPEGHIALDGKNTDYTLQIVLNDGYLVTDWYSLSVSGSGVDEAELGLSEDGYILTASNLNHVQVNAYNDNDKAKLSFSADADSVLLYEIDPHTIGVKIDSDGDGVYDELIAQSTGVLPGDANGDGSVNILDVITINRVVLGKEVLPDAQLKAIDFNGNDQADAEESLMILKHLVGIIKELG